MPQILVCRQVSSVAAVVAAGRMRNLTSLALRQRGEEQMFSSFESLQHVVPRGVLGADELCFVEGIGNDCQISTTGGPQRSSCQTKDYNTILVSCCVV